MAATRLLVLEAPAGYGKTTACGQFCATLDLVTVRVSLREPVDLPGLLSALAAACRRAGLASLAEAVDLDDPAATLERLGDRLQAGRHAVLAFDEAHRAQPDAAEWLARLVDDLPDTARLVIAGRRIGGPLGRMAQRADAAVLGAEDLRFDAEEVATLIAAARGNPADPTEIQALLAATDGWPAAVALAVARHPVRDPHGIANGPDAAAVLRGLVQELVAGAAPDSRETIGVIRGVPLLSAEVLDLVGGAGALDRLLDAGVPIRFRVDGWGELADAVRELLPERPLPVDVLRQVAGLYADDGELAEAAALLHRTGDVQGVLSLLSSQRRDALHAAGLAFFDAIVRDAPDATLAANPQALVSLVQAAERQPRLRDGWIQRSADAFPEGTPARRAVEAERALAVARSGDLGAAIGLAERVIGAAASEELVTLGRAHFAHALCRLLQDTAGSTADVGSELELAIGLFHLAGERGWEAEAHQALGYGVLFTTGAFVLAAQRLERAISLRPAPDGARAEVLACLGEVLTHLGRLDEANVALREAAGIGRCLGDDRTIAFAAWSLAEVACQRRDRLGALSALEEAEAHPEGWFNGLAGIDFLAHAAEIRTILGDEQGARRDLGRAEARASGTARSDAALSARARFEATYGAAAEALKVLDALDASPLAYRSGRWLRLLLRAAASARLGDRRAAAALAERARQAAIADLSDADRLTRREPELLAIATPGEDRITGARPASVVLLGRFAVERDGVDVSPSPGLPQTLVKLLALQRILTTDEAIDQLWPDADLDTGRARLRNLLNRVRDASGPIVVRREGGALALAETVRVDAQLFEQDAAAALSAPAEERASLARRALVRSTGELLPADRYADWAAIPRERLRRRHLALLDVVSEDAIVRGDLDEADRLLDAAIGSDPLEEVRYVRLARAMLAQGRVRQARRVAQQGATMAEDLGVEPGDALAKLLVQLSDQM